MSRYVLSAPAKQDLKEIKNGIQIERLLSGYRDFEEIFSEDEEN